MRKVYFILLTVLLVFGNISSVLAQDQSASLYMSPYSGTFFVGNTFDISVFLNSEGNVINALEVNLKFPADLLQVTSPTAGSSFISIWADQPSYSNKDGVISFKGGIPSPGIKTSSGLVSTITFRAKAPGVAKISFSDSSKVLLADGKGTNVLKSTAPGEYNLILQPSEGPKISSPTHPSLSMWYRNNNPIFYIEKEDGVTDFSYAFDQDPMATPDNISEGANNSVSFNDIGNGIWYFHAKTKKNSIWGGTSHYPVRIDSLGPESFKVKIDKIGTISASEYFAYFSTDDSLSGMDHYEISVSDAKNIESLSSSFFIETASPYRIPFEKNGKYLVMVRAYDKAGNFTQEQANLTVISQLISFVNGGIKIKNLFLPSILIYLIIGLIITLMTILLYHYLKRRNLVKTLKTEVAEAEKEIEDVKRLEKRIQEMRSLEEQAQRESERLAEKLNKKDG